jgi:hypothetical protein
VIGGRVGEGVELLGEAEFFDAALVQARAAAAAGQRGEEIERGRVGVVEAADGPAERDAAQLGGKFAAQFAALVLARLVREIEIGHLAARIFFEQFRRAGEDGFRRDGAADDQAQILRRVTLVVIGEHVVAGELVEEIEIADDRMAVGMADERGLEDELAEFGVGIVAAHGELAPDDFHLLVVFLGGDGRVEDGVAEDFQRGQRVVGGKIDVVDGAVEGGVGVEMAAEVLDLLRHLAVAARRRALEHEMLEQMRKARAEPRRFVDAAGGAPELDRDDRRGEVGLDEDVEAVGELANLDRRRRDQGMRILRLRLKACGESDGIKGRFLQRTGFFLFAGGRALLGLGAGGLAHGGVTLRGTNGLTKASSKVKTFLKSLGESVSFLPSTLALTRLKTIWPMSSVVLMPHSLRTALLIGPYSLSANSRRP